MIDVGRGYTNIYSVVEVLLRFYHRFQKTISYLKQQHNCIETIKIFERLSINRYLTRIGLLADDNDGIKGLKMERVDR